jgi:hypothetical protein
MKIRQNPTSHSARITLTDNPLKVSNLFFFRFQLRSITIGMWCNKAAAAAINERTITNSGPSVIRSSYCAILIINSGECRNFGEIVEKISFTHCRQHINVINSREQVVMHRQICRKLISAIFSLIVSQWRRI